MGISSFDLAAALKEVRQAASQLGTTDKCSEVLAAMGKALAQHQDDILEANTLDLEISRDMAVPELVVDWLKLTPERVQTAVTICQRLAAMGTPLMTAGGGQGTYGDYCARPVGVVGFIYEAFPDLGAIAAALCIRTGNALVLKGGSEASRTNQIIASILQSTLETAGLPTELIFSIESTAEVSRLDMAQCADIDLIIPHGRPSLVEQVVQQASVPVIPSRMGNCYLYWDTSGSLDQVYQTVVDSHTGTPDAVNRIEKVLLHESHSENSVTRLWNRLQEVGFEISASEEILHWGGVTQQENRLDAIDAQAWDTAYLKRKVAFRQVKDSKAAIGWINTHSSGHADSIITADYTESRRFSSGCQSASVYINTSPRFVRNAKQTGEIALGASDYKGACGGLIGMAVMQERQRIFHGC
ncbi:MAG: aldehyde dehydrogenase family protein [Phormidesmis sp.]